MNKLVLVGVALVWCVQASAGLFDSIKEAAGKALDDVSDMSKSAMKSMGEGAANGMDALADAVRPEETSKTVSVTGRCERIQQSELKQLEQSAQSIVPVVKDRDEPGMAERQVSRRASVGSKSEKRSATGKNVSRLKQMRVDHFSQVPAPVVARMGDGSMSKGHDGDVRSNFVAFVTGLFSEIDRYKIMRAKAHPENGNESSDAVFREIYSNPRAYDSIREEKLPFSKEVRTNDYYRCIVDSYSRKIMCPESMQALKTWQEGIEKELHARMRYFEVKITYDQFVNEELMPQKVRSERVVELLKECYEGTPWEERCHRLDVVNQKLEKWNDWNSLREFDVDLHAKNEYVVKIPENGMEEDDRKKVLQWIESTRKWLANHKASFSNKALRAYFAEVHQRLGGADQGRAYEPMSVYADVCFSMTPEMVYWTLVKNSEEGKVRAEKFNNSELFRGWEMSDGRNAKIWSKVPNGMSFVAKLKEHTVQFLFGAHEREGASGLIAIRLYFNDVKNSPSASDVGERYAKLPDVKMHKERKQNGSTWRKGINPFWKFFYETSMLQIRMTEQNGVGEFGPLTEQEKMGLKKLKEDMKTIEKDFATPLFVEMDVYESEGVKVTVNADETTKQTLSVFIDDVAVTDAMKALVGKFESEKREEAEKEKQETQKKKRAAALSF